MRDPAVYRHRRAPRGDGRDAAGFGGCDRARQLRRHAGRARLVSGLALLALLGPALACARAPVDPPRPRVFFLGLDGASWTVLGRLVEAGELPAFRRLLAEGTCLTQLDTLPETISPIVWTTIATGRAPQDHGVTAFVSQLPNGTKIPISSNARKARAIWELAARRGLASGVIGWWASWPAEEFAGYDITDHANPAFSDLLVADRNYWTADRATLARLERDFQPADLGPILGRYWIGVDDFPYAELARRGRFSAEQMALLRAAPWNERNLYSWLKTFYRVDAPLVAVARALMRERPVDLQMLYLRGADAVQHYGWDLVEPEMFAVPPAHLDRDRGLVEGVYRYLDNFLGELLADLPPDTWLIVASDHGGEASPHAHDPAHLVRPGEHGPNAKGVFFLRGPGVRRGARLESGSVYDLMPTMAWLLGLPLSAELPGQPLMAAFEPDFVASRPAQTVASYGERPTAPPIPSPLDAELIRSLKNLGYLQ